MAIIQPGDDEYPEDGHCFLCLERLDTSEPVVLWMGPPQKVYWHAGCIGSFVLRLARDAWELERDLDDDTVAFVQRAPQPK